jgi:hypothetical protein
MGSAILPQFERADSNRPASPTPIDNFATLRALAWRGCWLDPRLGRNRAGLWQERFKTRDELADTDQLAKVDGENVTKHSAREGDAKTSQTKTCDWFYY